MIEGLNSISDLLRLYRIKEELYIRDANKPAHPDFVQAVVELYSNIFEYQTRLICHLSQCSFKRGIRGTLELDNWGDILKKVQTSSDSCTQYCTLSDRTREKEFFDSESTRMLQSLDIQKRILDMFEASQASRQQDRRDDKEAELLKTLASDYKSDKDSVSARIPDTCEWFFKDDRFLKWRDSKHSRLLWVSAGPGCGKSVLSRSLIDERRVCTSAMASTVCYFFFKDGQKQRMRGANALSAVLHQLFENTALVSHALPSAKNYSEKLKDAFGELWEILTKCAQDSEAGEIICILDALDECEKDSRSQLLEKLVSFSSHIESHKSSSYRLKFLVTSRPYDDLEERFKSLSDVSTYLRIDGDDKSKIIGPEINLVIDREMLLIAEGLSDEHSERISKHLKDMDNRNYLWLFLTLDIIKGSRSKYSKMSSIDSLLKSLPSKVSDAYEEILSKSSDGVTARVLLQLIVAATRPLSLQEVNIALTVATQKASCTSYKALDQDLWPQQNFKSIVRNICGLFVSIHDGKVSLIHQTAREFLVRSTELPELQSGKWQGYLDMATAHCTMSQICLDYLNFNDVASMFQDQLDKDHRTQQGNESYFLNYTALNWPVHYVSQGSELAKDSWSAAKNLYNTLLPQQSYWFKIYCESTYLRSKDWTSLGIASLLGLKYVAESFLDEGADVNAQGGRYGNALQAASSGGHEKVVQMLLEKGADVNAQGGDFGNALQAASQGDHDQVVQMLLDKGADVNARGGEYGNALQAASQRGHNQVVQMLLDKGADVNAQGGYYGNALYPASERGHDQVVQMLLDKGAAVNAQGGYYGNALQAASYGGHDRVVTMLLDKGADVNAQGGSYGNALYPASERGHNQVVQMLLDKGADVNAQGGYYGNALQAASYRGHDRVVTMLLDKGADVNAQGRSYGNALYPASERGHDQVVQMLLDKGADVNAQGGYYGNALQAASYGGHDQVVQILLEKGADVNAQGGDFGNALYAASQRGHDQVVQMLLDKGADINAQGRRYSNALQAASSGGHDRVVTMLLEKGAAVNAQGDYCGNALQAASSGGHDQVMQMLLDKGAAVNAQGGSYGNALYPASERGHDQVVQMLLDKGADINAQGRRYGNAMRSVLYNISS